VVERPKAFHHVGLLLNKLPGAADFPTLPSRSLFSHPTTLNELLISNKQALQRPIAQSILHFRLGNASEFAFWYATVQEQLGFQNATFCPRAGDNVAGLSLEASSKGP